MYANKWSFSFISSPFFCLNRYIKLISFYRISLLLLTSFYADRKIKRWSYKTILHLDIVSIHLCIYIIIFVSQDSSYIPISKDEYSFIIITIIIIFVFTLICNMSLSKVIVWMDIYIYTHVFISLLYNNVLPLVETLH